MATIIIKNSTGSSSIPSSLQQGELAINTVTGKLFYGSGSGNVVNTFSEFPYTGSAQFTGSLTVSGNFTVHNTTTGFNSINSDSYYLFDNSGNRSVMWNDRVLKDSSGTNSVDWEGRQFADNNQVVSIDWQNRALYADDGIGGTVEQLNWSNNTYLQLPNVPTGSIPNILGIDSSGRLYTTASSALTVGTAQTASYLNTLNQNLTLSGSLTILNNLTVFGTQSINYITSSQLDISTNIITVNTSTPAVRFGGIAVRDSGSTGTGRTGSLLWDSQNDVWIYSNPSGAAYDGALMLVGPRNTSGLGNEVGITTNYLSKGDGSHHMTSSQISDNGTTVTIPGFLSVTGGITGSLLGTASWAQSASKITTNSDSAPVTMYLTYVRQTGSLTSQPGVNANLSYNTQTNTISATASQALTASYAMNAGGTFNSTSSIIGNGLSSSFNINHGFNTRNLHITVYESGSNGETVYPDLRRINANTASIIFANPPTSNQYIVYISQ